MHRELSVREVFGLTEPSVHVPAHSRSTFSIAAGTIITLKRPCFTSANSAKRLSPLIRASMTGVFTAFSALISIATRSPSLSSDRGMGRV